MLTIDSHLDLAMNALEWNRDLNLDVHAIRKAEAGMTQKGRARGTVTLPELRKAEVAVSLATVIDRTTWPDSIRPGSAHQEISYAKAQGQLAYYRVLEEQGKVRILSDWPSLQRHWREWQSGTTQEPPLGFILSMEGADPVVWPEQVESWWDQGMRVIGPTHYGVSAYAYGTGLPGPLTERGRELLVEMDRVGMILDLTHLAEEAFWQAMEIYQGPVLASHNNCRTLVPGDRQFSDDQLRAIFERGGVIGVALDAWMLYPGWIIPQTQPDVVTMDAVAEQIDHICQVAGNTDHAGIGSDLDGGYGTEQTPGDLDTIVDLQKIPDLLRKRGYAEADIEKIMHGNWLRFFRQAWTT
jgi:membrane dipeptidase